MHQFVLATGVPHFCHVKDLGKTVRVALPGGRSVHHTLCRPITSAHHYDLRVRSSEDSTSGGGGSTAADQGMHPAPIKLEYVLDTCSHVNIGRMQAHHVRMSGVPHEWRPGR